MLFEFDLDTALREFPLPEGQADADMNREQLARAFATSVNTIDKWRDKGMPVEEEGGNGRSYAFKLSHCWAWHGMWKRDDKARRDEADAAAQQMAMNFLNAPDSTGSMAGLTSTDLAEFRDRERFFNEMAEGRRERVLRSDVIDLMGLVFQIIRQSLEVLPDAAEQKAGLSPNQTSVVIRECDGTMKSLREAVNEHLIFKDVGATVDGSANTTDPPSGEEATMLQ